MGQSPKRIGGDGVAPYTAYYNDITSRRRSAGTSTTEKQADKAWQRAEAGVAEGRMTDLGQGHQRFARYVTEVWRTFRRYVPWRTLCAGWNTAARFGE